MKRNLTKIITLNLVLIFLMSVLISGCTSNSIVPDAEYTSSFSIVDYGDGTKLVTDAEGQKFFLVPKAMDKIPEKPDDASDAVVIRTPIDNAVFCSTTQIGVFRSIATNEVLDSIGAVTSPAGTWNIDEIETRLENGTIKYVGGDNMGEPDYEAIQALSPEMVFIYTGEWGQQKILAKMQELGIPCSVDNEFLETDYMARLEWCRFIAAFYDMDDEAVEFMEDQKILLEDIKKDTQNLEKPTVAWFSIFDGKVYITGSGSYVAQEISDAGGDYIFKDYDPLVSQITLEELYAKAKEADVVIYSSNKIWMMNPSIEGIIEMAPVLEDIKAIKNGNVYCFSDIYQTAIDLTVPGIKDLASIFHPELYTSWEISMFEKLPASIGS